MEIVINTAYGNISTESAKLRRDPLFIADVKSGRFVGRTDGWGYAELLRVVEIPDAATDYQIVQYDGSEMVIYCLDGKIHYTPTDTTAAQIFHY